MVTGSTNQPLVPPAVASSIERWQQALLDLTKRNRALNFRANRVSTVVVVGEQPPEVFRRLYVDGDAMGFSPAPSDAPAQATPADTWDFAPYDRTALAEQHTDAWLQTRATAEDLAKSLRRIDDLARGSLEEQGVNTLFLALGMLHYKEAEDAEQVFAAPLVLLPVRMVRAAKHSAFEIIAADDDVAVNRTLVEYLRKLWGIELPTFSETEPDLQQLFVQIAERIRGRAGWRLTNEIVLSLFSFEKLVMFKELEASAAAIGAHPLVQQLVTRHAIAATGLGLPADVQQARLDEVIPPERSTHLVPADGSQLRALLAVGRGHSLVIEGPPGTGKSQTITNLVAQSLAAGKSVLFVAEKRAALDVVHARLQASGLGEFCLALHSPDANRRAVFEGMRAALDASAEPVVVRAPASTRLPAVRATLSDYDDALHRERAPQGASVFAAFGTLAGVADAPLLPWDGGVGAIDAAQIELAQRSLRDLSRAADALGDPATHPWRDTERTSYPELVLQELLQVGNALDEALLAASHCASQAAQLLGLPRADTLAWMGYVQTAADVLGRSPGAPLAVLHDPAWDQPHVVAQQLVQAVVDAQQLQRACAARLVADALRMDHAPDIAYVRGKRGIAAAFTWLDGRYKAIVRRWEALRVPGSSANVHELALQLEDVGRLQQMLAALQARDVEARALFGALWRGADSDAAALHAYVQWVAQLRRFAGMAQLGAQTFELAARGPVDVTPAHALLRAGAAATGPLQRMVALVQWPAHHFDGHTFAAIRARITELLQAPTLASSWATYAAARQAAFTTVATAVAGRACAGTLPFVALHDAFVRSFWSRWVTDVIDGDAALAGFQGLVHDGRVEEFRTLDRQVLLENRDALVSGLRTRLQARLREPELQGEMATLLPELRKQGRHKPLRRTLLAASTAARAIHPCWLMSPLSAAQFTAAGATPFDLVIFDEASQLRPEDAIATIARGRQLVVVGDPKQLPPSDFFAAQLELGAPDEDDDHPDAPSILEVAGGAGLPSTRLKWHYRSAHESLIAFSNAQFYDAELRTFPSVERGSATRGLSFELVEDGRYEGSGRNPIEAARVVDAILEFAREQQRRPASERMSLGVGTFSLPQRLEIDELLYERLQREPSLAPFFDRDRAEPFFVKNLESIQGDERDAIFLSITYGRGADGAFRHNFGPLNRDGGWKRLNVITTRARQRMRVFSSIRGADIDVARAKIAGMLKGFLEYAETGRLQVAAAARAVVPSTAFEHEVEAELVRRGYVVQAQVGECGYRIDLAVCDPEAEGRYLLGIECDGAAYHASETARDRDRLREDVLRARGWVIARVWSTDWFKARAGQIERLLRAIEAARVQRRASEAARVQAPVELAPQAVALATPVVPDAPREAAVSTPVLASARTPIAAYGIAAPTRIPSGALVDAPVRKLAEVLALTVRVEGPIHEDELISRLAALWGHQRGGARIREHVLLALSSAQQAGLVEQRGEFVWLPGGVCVPRLRDDDTRVPADRIAPEEWDATIRWALAGGTALVRERLLAEVRGALGFARTGKNLEACIGERIDAMRAAGELVEVSGGLRLR